MEQPKLDIEKSDITIQELLFMVMRHSKIFSFSIALVLLAMSLFLLIADPQYSSEGKILIERDSSKIDSIFEIGLDSNEGNLDNEIEILNSRSTSESTVKNLFYSIDNGLHLFKTKEYETTYLGSLFDKFLFKDDNQKLISIDDKEVFDNVVRELRNNLKISNVRSTDVLKISYKSLDPNEAALIVNTLISEYQKRDLEWVTGEMSHLKNFLSEQLVIKKEELSALEVELKDFQENEHIYGLDENSQILYP